MSVTIELGPRPPEIFGQQPQGETIPEIHRPLNDEGVLIAERLIAEARANLPPYDVEVVRRTTHKDKKPERDEFGTYYQETVRFNDGAVRLLTIGEPDPNRVGTDNISPIPIAEGDSLFTGPHGLSKNIMRGYMGLGIPVYWVHHQGRHSVKPDSMEHLKTLWHFISAKGVGRSTHQEHALFDDLGMNGHQTKYMMRGGFSRSSMQAESFISTQDEHDRTTVYSDTQATCFAHEADARELIDVAVKQLPREAWAGIKLLSKLGIRALKATTIEEITSLAGTIDLHPLNMAHELAWLRLLTDGASGIQARAIPLGHVGVRTVLSGDTMSHGADQQQIHNTRPEMEVIVLHKKDGKVTPEFGMHDKGKDLMHVDGASPKVLQLRLDRLARAMVFAKNHGMNETSLLGLKKKDVLPR